MPLPDDIQENARDRSDDAVQLDGYQAWSWWTRSLLTSALVLTSILVHGSAGAQSSLGKWEIGAIELTIGEDQAQVLEKISSLYRVTYNSQIRQFSVYCRDPDSFVLQVANLDFSGNRLRGITVYMERDCSQDGGRPDSKPAAIVLKLAEAVTKVERHAGRTCTVSARRSRGALLLDERGETDIRCGPNYGVRFTTETYTYWSVIVEVK